MFTDDASVSLPGDRVLVGKAALSRMFGTSTATGEEKSRSTRHVITNIRIPEGTAERLTFESCYLVLAADGSMSWGRYCDEAIRSKDGWRFSARTILVDGRRD